VWACVQLILLIPVSVLSLKQYSKYSSTLISVLSLIVSIIAAWRKNKEERIAKEELLDESATNAVSEARKLVDRRMWSLSIIEAFRSLELSLNKKLIDLGFDSRQFQSFRAVEILAQKEILSKEDLRDIHYIRDARNKAAHSSIDFSEKEAEEILSIVKRLLPKLETTANKVGSLERNIIQALIGENGLFPKDNLHIQNSAQDLGYYAKGRGPNHDYMIEIKLTRNVYAVRHSFHQLKNIMKQNDRLLFIVPKEMKPLNIGDDNARLLYYDTETGQFTNKDEIYNWIYGIRNK
jgi:HEPN domain-containing protein